MSLPEAAARTLEFVPYNNALMGEHETSARHIRSILNQIINESVTGSQAQRYLGFAQGVIASYTDVSLHDLRLINRECGVEETADTSA